MPIFEFKCLKCQEYIEILVMGNNDNKVEMKCTKCGSVDIERILSSTSYAMSDGGGKSQSSASAQTRTCSGGSCTTWDLPGHSR